MDIKILTFDGADEMDFVAPFEAFRNAARTQENVSVSLVSLSEPCTIMGRNGLAVRSDGVLIGVPNLLVVPGGGWVDVHLSHLLEGGLVKVAQDGRHRYYQIASPEVAHAVEGLGVIASPRKQKPLGEGDPICYARTCYDQLAGAMAVSLAESLQQQRYLVACADSDREFDVTAAGEEFLKHWRIDVNELRSKKRSFARRCLELDKTTPSSCGSARCRNLSSVGGSPINSSFDLNVECFHDLWGIEADLLESLGCSALRVLESVLVFPNRGCHDIAFTLAVRFLIHKALDKSRQRS